MRDTFVTFSNQTKTNQHTEIPYNFANPAINHMNMQLIHDL